MFYCKINEGIFFKYFDHFEYLFAASCQTDVRFNARSLCNLRLCDLTCVCGNNMLHLVICAAWISASVNVTLFEQLWKTSSRESSHAAHMLFSFCHYLSSNCLHLPSGSSPVHHSPPLRTSLPSSPLLTSPPSVSCSDLADNLPVDDFTFQEQLLTPGLSTAGVGGVSSPAAPLWRSSRVLSLTLLLLLPGPH